MRIAICDDEKKWIDIIKRKIVGLRYDDMMDIVIDCFTNQDELILKSNVRGYDLVYLDIEMEGMNGIEVAKKLKEYNDHCIVIFVTAYQGYVHDAFEVSAFQFIEKPIDDELFERAFRKAVETYKKSTIIKIFRIKGGTISLNLNDIICVESYYNTVLIKTVRGTYPTNYAQLRRIRIALLDQDFIRVQAGLIINMHFIEHMRYREILMKNKTIIPVSFTHYKDAAKKYHRFLNISEL